LLTGWTIVLRGGVSDFRSPDVGRLLT